MNKNEARKVISEKQFPQRILEQCPNNSEIYFLVEEKFNY